MAASVPVRDEEDEAMLEAVPPHLSEGEVEAFLGGVHDSCVATREEDIDAILYGGEDVA